MRFSVAYEETAGFLHKAIERGFITELFASAGVILKNRGAVVQAREKGMDFCCLFEQVCFDNSEQTAVMRKRLDEMFSQCRYAKINRVSISSPFILGFIKKNYPEMKITVSAMAQVDSVERARFWEALGADTLILEHVTVNRNFDLLKKIRRAVSCKIELIANSDCIYDCPCKTNHAVWHSHSGYVPEGFVPGKSAEDIYWTRCYSRKIDKPVDIIRAAWIRPEDTILYEELGIDSLRILAPYCLDHPVEEIVQAYFDHTYDGNLLEILGPLFPSSCPSLKNDKTCSRSGLEDIFYLDNRQLDGYVSFLREKKCSQNVCDECGWCSLIAEKSLSVSFSAMQRREERFVEL